MEAIGAVVLRVACSEELPEPSEDYLRAYVVSGCAGCSTYAAAFLQLPKFRLGRYFDTYYTPDAGSDATAAWAKMTPSRLTMRDDMITKLC